MQLISSENNRYVSQGKLGAALLGNHDNRSYKLILYTGKQQHITYATINDNFKLIVSDVKDF